MAEVVSIIMTATARSEYVNISSKQILENEKFSKRHLIFDPRIMAECLNHDELKVINLKNRGFSIKKISIMLNNSSEYQTRKLIDTAKIKINRYIHKEFSGEDLEIEGDYISDKVKSHEVSIGTYAFINGKTVWIGRVY